MNQDTTRNDHQDTSDQDTGTENAIRQKRPRRNPRIVIGSLEYFDMLMEQDEQG